MRQENDDMYKFVQVQLNGIKFGMIKNILKHYQNIGMIKLINYWINESSM